MKNSITVVMSFYYAGKAFEFESMVNMPTHLGNLHAFADTLPRKIGRLNNIDSYSYIYEVMECTPIKVIKAEGFVAQFLTEAPMLIEDFLGACSQVSTEQLLSYIISQHLPKMANNEALNNALMEAYTIGLAVGEDI